MESASEVLSVARDTLLGAVGLTVAPKIVARAPNKVVPFGACLAAAAGVGVAVYYRHTLWNWWRAARISRCVSKYEEFVASSALYVPGVRDCEEGEQADVLVSETVTEPGVEEGVSVRVTKKKKYVHRPFDGAGVSGPYLSDVVADARLHYNHREATPYNKALAKAYMVRAMTSHGMRASHITQHIDAMVLAVFVVLDSQLRVREEEALMRSVGRIGGSTGV